MGFAQDGVLGANPTVNQENLTLFPLAAGTSPPIDRRNLRSGCSTSRAMVNAALPGSSVSGAAAASAAEQDAQSIGAMPGVSQDSSECAASTQLAPRSRRPRASDAAVSKLKSVSSPASTHEETQGQHTHQELASLIAEGVITDRPRKKLKGPLDDHTVLSPPVAFKERTITEIYMQSSGSEKIGTLQNEEEETTPARKAKPRRKRHRAKVIREDKQGKKKQDHPTVVTTPEVKSTNQNGKTSFVRKTRYPSSLDNKCSGPGTNSFVPVMDFSSGKSFSGGSIGLEGSDGKCQQTSLLAPKTNLDIHCEAPGKNTENTSTATYMNLLQRVTSRMEYLNLNTEHVHTDEMHRSVTTSAVVSSGAAGGLLNSLVPYVRPLNLLKKRRPRAKVNLDFETTRVWNLLMGKSTEPLDGTDVDKERWWQKERELFEGRANSFIKRMRLIQGDRHFTSWKGSVVDSVVGVFLTQNVSDHRSSSAYMALAASFPPESVNNNCKDDITCQDNEEIVSTSAVGGISMFDFFDNSRIPDIGEHFEDLSITYEKIHVETKTNGATGKKLPLVMPSDNHASQENCTNTVTSTQNSPNMRTDLPAELHCDKSTRFEASDLQQHESLSATGEMIEETENRVNGFTLKSGLDEAAHASRPKKVRTKNKKNTENLDWDKFRRQACENGHMKERISERRDSVDWEAVRCADVHIISHVIQERGMHNNLGERIQKFLNRLVRDHGSIDLEWLRAIPPDSAKDYLLSIRGLGLKSVECVRLLTLHQIAFPVDTNVGRICVRLGWVPIQPLPESLQLHLIEQYPVLETIQKYLWPRLCKLDQRTLYELHCHMITSGKVFCTKAKPNCNACPMRSECRHFASAFASARLGLPAPEEKSLVYSSNQFNFQNCGLPTPNSAVLPQLEGWDFLANNLEPIIEEPESPREEERPETLESDIEDYDAGSGEIPIIKLNLEAFAQNLENCIKDSNNKFRADDIAKALVAIRTEAGSIPVPKLKNIHRLRTEHYVYEIPDSHSLVQQLGLDPREPDDPSPYLLTIWLQDDIKELSKAPKPCCDSQMEAGFCKNKNCQYCGHERANQDRYVRGTILVPCRTAMKGRFPLNGTYFQVNEVFADDKSSHDPVHVVREQLWDLPRRMVYFGTSVPAIFKGLTTEEVQKCFWRGFVCVRGFDMETRAPRPLCPHLHLAASKLPRSRKSTATDEHNSDPARASVS